MTRHTLLMCIVLVGVTMVAPGCFTYTAVPPNGALPDRGAPVRAHLLEPQRFPLRDVTAENVVRVDGEIIEWDSERLLLSAYWMRSNSGLAHNGVGETVVLDRSALSKLERKRFSIGKSAALAGAVVLFSVFLNSAFEGGGGGEPPPSPPPGGK